MRELSAKRIGWYRLNGDRGWLQACCERYVRHVLRQLERGGLKVADSSGPPAFFGVRGELHATVTVQSPRFWADVALGGTLGAAESYILGRWTVDDLTALCRIFARNLALTDGMERGWARASSLAAKSAHALRGNTRKGALRNIEAHYDLGNDFFRLVLDETMS